jgi:hypothetical protein
MNRSNGGYIGILKEDLSVHPFSGIYPLYEQQENKLYGVWPDRADASFANTTILLKTNNQSIRSTTATDSSANSLILTRTGTPSTGWTSPYQTVGYWSNYFNGTSYLSNASSSAFTFGTADFTVEYWIFVSSLPAVFKAVCGGAASSATDIFFGFNGSGSPYASHSANWPVYTTTLMPLGAWTHIAFTRSSGTWKIYINGVDSTFASQSNPNITTATLGIGALSNGTNGFTGYLSNLRVIKGQALISTGNFTPPTSPVTATTVGWTGANVATSITGTVSLLACQNNRFIDNSTNNILTPTSSPQISSSYYPSTFPAPDASVGAVYLNGTTDYLSAPSATAFAFGSGVDFTVECWVYLTAYSSGGTLGGALVGTAFGGFTGWFINSGQDINTLRITSNASGSWADNITVSAGNGLQLNQWTHIAFVRNGGNLTLYKNGISAASMTGASAYNFTSPTNTVYIGICTDGSSSRYVPGYISNVRIVKGTAVYTGNFTPPTNFLTQVGGTYSNTANLVTSIASSNTSLLVNFADSNFNSPIANTANNNLFIDNGPYAYPVSRVGTATQGGFSPFLPDGYWSNYFLTTDSINNTTSTAGVFNSNNFTVECWFYPLSTATSGLNYLISSLNGASSNGWQLYYNNTGWGVRSNFTNFISGAGASNIPTVNAWNHIAWCRNDSSGTATYYLYLNGKRINANDTTMGTWTDVSININLTSGNNFNGYISNVRLVNGVAVYAAGAQNVQVFTPPSLAPLNTSGLASAASYPSTTNVNTTFLSTSTTLLTCQSSRFKDNSVNNVILTPNGSSIPKTQVFQPFPLPISYNKVAYSGSIYNTVKTDALSVPSVSQLTTFTGDFTMECWVYPTDTSFAGSWGIIDSRTNGQTATAWVWSIGGYSSGYTYSFYTGTQYNFTTKVPAYAWTHLVLQRNGTTVRGFINGVVDATTATISGTITGGTSTLSINNTKDNGLTSYGNIGYTSNLRIVNGTAVYPITGFTPSTVPLTAIPNTTLLLKYDNFGIYDATTQNNLVTVGSAQVSNTLVKWAPTSMQFGAANYLTSTYNINWFTFGSYTLEFWVYHTSLTPTLQAYAGTGSTGYTSFYVYSTGSIGMGVSGSTEVASATGIITLYNWQHVAYTYNGTTTTIYVNGVSVASSTSTNLHSNNSAGLQIGNGLSSVPVYGYMQDFRITKSVRYTGNFTPPTLPFLTV